MIKRIIILLLVAITLFFTSCSIGGLISDEKESDLHPMLESRITELNKNAEEEIADAMIDKILLIIKDKDRDTIKALFSNQALGEIDDFDGDFDYLISFFQGDVISWERELWHSSEKTRDGGEKSVIASW